ncbi:DUF4365 domain-containing protein [Rhizobium sp. P32RR-XVIII]|uniref:DUF4365 domain-containing protein n=1 Tax=Rhizobium sp. P32RR-XVIII TaxID=2726738 RepID=UPI0014576A23|nr:DUF4365 domain-containing protein [Rhizobium sp. P32RR-XVIII]NLS07889.1 DUF4365 domain-containing protein [Rhizobium sp. P32RR-XVIII]
MVRVLQAGLIAIGTLITATLRFFVVVRYWIVPGRPPPRRRRNKEPGRSYADPKTRIAIDAVEKVFVRDFKWSFRRLPASKIGIDARAEILDGGRPKGKFLPLQIRSIPSWEETGDGYIHRGESSHLDYWAKHSLHVYVVIVDAQTGMMRWQRAEKGNCEETETEWSIVIPAANLLDATARLCFDEAIASDPETLLRSAFALDRELMEEVQDQTTYFVWDEWGDTTAIFCNLRIYIGEGKREEPDVQIDYHLRANNLHEIMIRLFPWAAYSYAEPIKEYSGEVAVHVLDVKLRPEAEAYLEFEDFLEAGYPDEEMPWAPESEGYVTAEEEEAFWRSRGVSRGHRDREK